MVQLYSIIAGSRQPIAFKAVGIIKPARTQWPTLVIAITAAAVVVVIAYAVLRVKRND
jgi:hypothetical protein